MRKKTLLALAISTVALSAQAETPSLEEMWALIQSQQAEISSLKAQLNKTESKLEQTEVIAVATADAVEQGAAGSAGVAKLASWAEKTSIGGYGEHHFNHFEDSADIVDAHRYVLYVSHQYSDKVRFFSEWELEHSLAGDGKPGEVELEQAFIEWDYADNHSVQIGQFLVPVGIINETHEPDTFYGTERNQVEGAVIPATWWETGVMLKGEIAPGLSYNLAVHSGLEIDTVAGKYKIRDGRQKSAKAVAEDLALTARLKYTGIQGLELAATWQQQQDVTQGIMGDEADATLIEMHAAYRTGAFGLRALYASWEIDGSAFEANGSDQQQGWYVEPSYKLTDKLGAFVRYSEFNNQSGSSASIDAEVWDYGVNYWLTPNVVLKADYTDFVNDNSGSDKDALNLGVGWSF